MADDYIKKAILESAKDLAELFLQDQALMMQHHEIGKKKFALMTKLHSLTALCDDIPPNSDLLKIVRKFEKEGLTEAIEHILSGTGEWMSPSQIRDYLIRFRIDLTRYKNPGGSIHTILGRLVDRRVVETKVNEKTKRQMFRYKQPHFPEPKMSTEQLASELIAPRPRKLKKGNSEKKAIKPAKALLTEGSLKVN